MPGAVKTGALGLVNASLQFYTYVPRVPVRRWYDFITSLCAIIGGTFTVVGLVDTLLHKLKAGKVQL